MMRAWLEGMLLAATAAWLGIGAATSATILVRQVAPAISFSRIFRR